MNASTAIVAVVPASEGSIPPVPLGTCGAVPKMKVRVASMTTMPDEPTRSSRLRPTRSMSAIATSVVATLMALVIIEVWKAWSWLKPTDSQMRFE